MVFLKLIGTIFHVKARLLALITLLLVDLHSLEKSSTEKNIHSKNDIFKPQRIEIRPKIDSLIYTVKPRDTLSYVAKHYGTTIKKILETNNIFDADKIEVGTKILLYPDSKFYAKKKYIWPIKNPQVSSEFGSRRGKHRGIDIKAVEGTPVMAAADGVVIFSGAQRGYGNVIIIQHQDDIRTLYAHNSKNHVSRWQDISQGDVIAEVGSTGNARGNHVHFEFIQELNKLNPRDHVGPNVSPADWRDSMLPRLASQTTGNYRCGIEGHNNSRFVEC